ncbi:MAG: hypothetical protein EZS28_018642 [Streblomastix strix]|uniref:Uncharacterized protein n=1 Tax=Streblomastix strix TaxID=222440 RepID=A0A5J4VU43_9EUKA|nr:MAG: hypothetical protein EZS28_018642 [Streblomastix strix]
MLERSYNNSFDTLNQEKIEYDKLVFQCNRIEQAHFNYSVVDVNEQTKKRIEAAWTQILIKYKPSHSSFPISNSHLALFRSDLNELKQDFDLNVFPIVDEIQKLLTLLNPLISKEIIV